MEGESSRSRGAKEARKIPILPWELVIEILLRLPVKSLFRFKCVCKSWLSLLSDPHFATSHFQRPTANTARLLLIAPPNPEIRSIDFNASLHDDSATYTLNLDFLSPRDYNDLRIIGSCRGFLLLNSYQSLWVWNPSTGVHKKLPSTLIESNLRQPMFPSFLYGFGYDPSTDDYLVVKVSCKTEHAITRVEFFSLRTNVWGDVEATHLSYMNDSDDIRGGSLLNGAIHWLAYCGGSMDVIVVFDLTERKLSEMLLPVELLDYDDIDYYDLGVLGDLLSISFVEWDGSLEIWVMEEYGVQSSWTKTIVVSAENMSPDTHFFPICYTKGGDIFGKYGGTGLAKYNGMGQLQQHRSYCSGWYGFVVAVYTESLLSFPM
ncbi:F-box/kelch-repeat protein At3g23880-like [Vigna unguiculata]|uniref:F-box protein 22 n=1 Tax=Vigna unguiculata TaxID=3917 RepID=A0A4D6NQF7_VIGUN|nr:F-box/kelch-repeat protein At3g23880-like [Vigna unguiculata]XP_027904255.1 F-box/kelch-repeat protein At3g23880-like [Vigna unguiculata]QCE15608.1 F-box protein 22 [Vigna unguiculata]